MPTTIVKGRVRRLFAPSKPMRVRRRRFARVRRSLYNPAPVFTETADLGSFQVPVGGATPGLYLGQLQVNLNTIPQIASYQNLYNCARILKVRYIMMPTFNNFGPFQSTMAATQSVSAPRLAYAIQDTSSAPAPVSELDVLSENGSKVRMFTRPVNISHRPVPGLSEGITTGGFAAVTRKRQWITLNAGGLTVPHGSVNYAVTQDNYQIGNPQVQWNVYAKITFQLRDPK